MAILYFLPLSSSGPISSSQGKFQSQNLSLDAKSILSWCEHRDERKAATQLCMVKASRAPWENLGQANPVAPSVLGQEGGAMLLGMWIVTVMYVLTCSVLDPSCHLLHPSPPGLALCSLDSMSPLLVLLSFVNSTMTSRPMTTRGEGIRISTSEKALSTLRFSDSFHKEF